MAEWGRLNSDITKLSRTHLHTVGAVSRYDAEYMQYYTGIRGTLISSFGGFYMTNNDDKRTIYRKEILVFRQKGFIYSAQPGKDFLRNVRKSLEPELIAEWVYTLYPFYKDSDLIKHPAVIMLPYSVMSYRFTEMYALTIPIFVPSPKFYLEYYDKGTKMFGLGWDRTSTKPPMCKSDSELERKMRPSTNRLSIIVT